MTKYKRVLWAKDNAIYRLSLCKNDIIMTKFWQDQLSYNISLLTEIHKNKDYN